MLHKATYFSIAFLLVAPIIQLSNLHGATALSGSQFQAGRIMDDPIFFQRGGMSANQIQSFLNAKVPSCDRNGTKTIYDSRYSDTVTRKKYAERRGVSTPFICLKDFRQNTPSRSGETDLCNSMSAKSNQNAAQIIDYVSRACGVGAKSLLVLLQKEQSLITDDWPWPIQYRSATGYGCPDTAACDSQYYGFFNQVYHAARQFKNYAKNPYDYNYLSKATNRIQWHPNGSCGSSNVYIENQTTAGLYNYTPYRPNSAALANLYGEGNGCSAYGNRNFWRMYNDWFGSVWANPVNVTVVDNNTSEGGDSARVRFSLANKPTSNVEIPLDLSDSSEGTLNGISSITITPNNWNRPTSNEVYISGIDDNDHDGDIGYLVYTGSPVSNDTIYGNLSGGSVPNARIYNFDNEPDIPITGDWDGDGKDDIGVKRGNVYYFDYNRDGRSEFRFSYGLWSDEAIVGDWDADGKDEIALKRDNTYFLSYRNDGRTDITFRYGQASDKPLAGDWDKDRRDEIALKRGNTYFLNYDNDGRTDFTFRYGTGLETPITGDWDRDGRDELGLKSGNTYFLNYDNDGRSNYRFGYGTGLETPITGDWDRDGRDELGLKSGNTYFLNFNNDGRSNYRFRYGR